MNVGIFNLERDHQDIKGDLLRTFEEVLTGGQFILGKNVKDLEEAFARYIGVRFAIGVGNGTDAVRIGGMALGLKAGDKLVTTPNTYIATAMALSMQGVAPLFCDIEEETFNMDPESLEQVLKKHPGVKVCIPVHLYGHPARMDEITDICDRHGVAVMEDACQAHGARYKGRKAGSLGRAATFSFFPTKNLGCYGDGGIVVTDSEEVYDAARKLRDYGQETKHVHITEGFNSRLDEVQAAMLKVKLPLLDEWNEKRRSLASLYCAGLAGTPVILPIEAPYAHHVYHLFVIRSGERAELMKYLANRGVTTLIHYPIPIHLQEVYRGLGLDKGSFPKAEKAAAEVISLPLYPSLDEEEVRYVCNGIREFYGVPSL